MAGLFNERERTAENIFAHDEELRFLARRRGFEVLAAWAAESMELSEEDRSRYTLRIVGDFVSGVPEQRLMSTIQTDLERAGKPALSTSVGTVLAQAVADATLAQRGPLGPPTSKATDPRAEWARNRPKSGNSWGWSL
jgi:hypothetical protein